MSVSEILHNYHNSNRICIVHNLIRGLSGFEYLQNKYTYMYVVVKVFTPPVARVVEEFLNIRTLEQLAALSTTVFYVLPAHGRAT